MAKERILIVIITFTLFSCANPIPPSGGPPDTSPPFIVSYSPENSATNYVGNKINIKFNKWMNRNKVIENIFISPSAKLDFDWSGKELEIEILDDLRENTTYSFTLGAEYSDIFNNLPESGFSLVFSTGSQIDSGYIEGKLFDKNPSGAYVFAYRIDNISADTLSPSRTKPDYRIQTGTSGAFRIQALKDGVYRLFSVRDKFKDELINDGIDDFSSASDDIIVEDGHPNQFVNIKIGAPADNTPPILYGVEPFSAMLLTAEFSEPISNEGLEAKSVAITDSLGIDTVRIATAFINPKAMNRVMLYLLDSLSTELSYRLVAVGVKDTTGNIISDTLNSKYFRARSFDGLPKFDILSRLPSDSAKSVDRSFHIEFTFNLPVVREEISQALSLVTLPDSTIVPSKIRFRSANSFIFGIDKKLSPSVWHKLLIDYGKISSVDGQKIADSILSISFQTEDTRSYGAVEGYLVDSSQCSKNIIIILRSEAGKTYQTKVRDNGKWEFSELPEDSYSVEMFCDDDENDIYSYGSLFPHRYSERFFVSDKKIQVKPRWKVEDIILYFPKPKF